MIEKRKDEITSMAAPGVHRRVLDLMRNEPRGRVLDLGAGKGNISTELKKLDFHVIACDINPQLFRIKGIRCDYADLNQKLPYETESFDYVMCVEVIEHLENPHHVIREIARVLRPEGKVVVTTPNIANFYSRLHFLK